MTAPASGTSGGGGIVTVSIVAHNAAKTVITEVNRELQRTSQTAEQFGRTVEQRVGSHLLRVQGSARGIDMTRQALQSLAFQATGTQGAVGKLSVGLLTFAGGSTLVLGVVAGIGLIAAAMKLLGKEQREAEERTKKLADAIKELRTQAPAAGALDRLTQARASVTEAEERLEARLRMETQQRLGQTARGPITEAEARRQVELRPSGATAAVQQEVARARELVSLLEPIWREAHQDVVDDAAEAGKKAGERQADEWLKALRARIAGGDAATLRAIMADLERRILVGGEPARQRLGPAFLEAQQGLAMQEGAPSGLLRARRTALGLPLTSQEFRPPEFGAGAAQEAQRLAARAGATAVEERRLQMLQLTTDTLNRLLPQEEIYRRQIELLTAAAAQFPEHADRFREAIAALRTEMGRSGRAAQLAAAQMVTAFSSLIAGLIQGGQGAGGLLQTLGGVVGLIPGSNPLIAAALGGVGAIVTSLEGGAERRHREVIGAINQTAERIRGEPQRITLLLVTAEGDRVAELEYELDRRTARDAVIRLPTR